MKYFFVVLIIIPFLSSAQPQTNLSNDKQFFKEKSIEYNKWLKNSGFGKVLHVQQDSVLNSAVALYLAF